MATAQRPVTRRVRSSPSRRGADGGPDHRRYGRSRLSNHATDVIPLLDESYGEAVRAVLEKLADPPPDKMWLVAP